MTYAGGEQSSTKESEGEPTSVQRSMSRRTGQLQANKRQDAQEYSTHITTHNTAWMIC